MQCPKCGKELKTLAIGEIEVDRCPSCGGILFDKNELEKAKNECDRDLSWIDLDLWSDESQFKSADVSGNTAKCPRDGKNLVAVKYGASEITVEICPLCHSVWLDKSEFEKIIKELEAKISEETFGEYARDLEKEMKDLLLEPGNSKEELRNIAIIMKLMAYRFAAQNPKISEIISALPD